MRGLMYFMLLILVTVFAGCGGSSTAAVTPPAGLDDQVRIPAELQATYDEVEALIQAQGPMTIIDLANSGTLAQRRVVVYRYWEDAQDVIKNEMIVHAYIDLDGGEYSRAQGIADQLGATISSDLHYLSSQWYVFKWPADKTIGELVWIADWIMQQYPGTIKLVEPNVLVGDDNDDTDLDLNLPAF